MKNILMNTEMTKAILEGRKVQTRRVIGNDFEIDIYDKNGFPYQIRAKDKTWWTYSTEEDFIEAKAKYKIGETIWVREPATVWALTNNIDLHFSYNADNVSMTKPLPDRFYDENNNTPKWTDGHENGRGIPNGCIAEMARIFLKITNVRVERLRNMGTVDKINEGCFLFTAYDWLSGKVTSLDAKDIHDWWKQLWNSTAPKNYKWEDNPYVFVYEFERVEK